MAKKLNNKRKISKKDIDKSVKSNPYQKGSLILMLKDERGQLITTKTKIIIKDLSTTHKQYAESKSGEVTRFIFELPPNIYSVHVLADGFRRYSQSVKVLPGQESNYEFIMSLREPYNNDDDEEGEAELVQGRFTWFNQQRTYPSSEFPKDAREKALRNKKFMKSKGPIQIPGCNWLSNGPRNINGRIRDMAIHPADGNTVYAGSANGGIWVTRDAGQSWISLMRDEDALEIGAVAVHLKDPANPMGDTVIYAGTGEATWWPGYPGIGVLKSVDSGVTWNRTATMPSPGNDRFSAIVIDPLSITSDPTTTVIYAGGTPGGLYKSNDSGFTWQSLLNKNITGLVMDPTNHTIIYAAVASEGIYKYDPTTNTWNTFNTGFTTPFPQLILIAIGQSSPYKMYAKLDETVYRYDSTTTSWRSLGNHGGTTYGYWNNVLSVDPTNSDIIFAGGIGLERSSDGGTSWQSVFGLHVDQHALVFDSTNHLNVYAGNDGGVYRGTYASPTDNIGVWVKVSDGLIITQFNQVGVSSAGLDVFGGGTQDNGTNRTVGGLTWNNILGADGGFFIIDPSNPYILYAETQNGGIYKSTNGGLSWVFLNGFPGGPWVTPIVLDHASPLEPNRVLFAGGNSQVYRTADSGATWIPSSPNVGGQVNTIAVAPASSAIIYAGTGAGRIWRSSDNGTTTTNWIDITVGTVTGSVRLPGRSITDIIVHPTDPNVVYVTFSGFQSATPTTPGHVFRGTSTDMGATWKWENISPTLLDIPVNAIQVSSFSSDTLYIGTDVGVFRTNDGGLSWQDFESGFPNVVVADLALNSTGDILRTATYGRGMLEIRLDTTMCPDVDIYVRDNKLDTGETIPSPTGVTDPTTVGSNVYWWESADIKIDAYPYYPLDALFDGVEFDFATNEDVVRNDSTHPNPNRLYVQVHNRGPLPAHNVKVKVLWLDCAAGQPLLPADFWSRYPNDWTAPSSWNTVNPGVPFQLISELLPNTPNVLTWNWTIPPTANEHVCMLAVISSDEDPVTRSDTVADDHMPWIIAPTDKHIAQRNLHVITAAAPSNQPEPIKTLIDFHNPFDFPQYFDIIIDTRMLQKGSKLSILLPKVETRVPLTQIFGKGIEITTLSKKEWWGDKVKGISNKYLKYHCSIKGDIIDHSHDGIEVIPDILIPASDKIQSTLIFSSPPKAKAGSSSRFVIMQRQKKMIITGGSTYEIRIPPAEVRKKVSSK